MIHGFIDFFGYPLTNNLDTPPHEAHDLEAASLFENRTFHSILKPAHFLLEDPSPPYLQIYSQVNRSEEHTSELQSHS